MRLLKYLLKKTPKQLFSEYAKYVARCFFPQIFVNICLRTCMCVSTQTISYVRRILKKMAVCFLDFLWNQMFRNEMILLWVTIRFFRLSSGILLSKHRSE